ncbi:hypothetical protein WJX74_008835 [Apatococcus lobatus]|uniref:Uncharacterized protein n=1 Tax=Apatococcus lobatus TaxID=904363 RepID=A0AAW1QZV8_9CHLO
MEAADFVQPGTPEQRMIFQLLERVERLERAGDGIGARVRSGVPFAGRDSARGIVHATEGKRSFFVRLYLREAAWAAAVGDPASEDAADGPLVRLIEDHIVGAVGRALVELDFVTHLHFDRHFAVTRFEKVVGRQVRVKVPVRCLEGVITTDSPAVTSALLADAFEHAWGDLLMEGGYREDLLDEEGGPDSLFMATTLRNIVEPCPHPEPVEHMMRFVGAKDPATYRMFYGSSRWPVDFVGDDDADRYHRLAKDARAAMRVLGTHAPDIRHPLVMERVVPPTVRVSFV